MAVPSPVFHFVPSQLSFFRCCYGRCYHGLQPCRNYFHLCDSVPFEHGVFQDGQSGWLASLLFTRQGTCRYPLGIWSPLDVVLHVFLRTTAISTASLQKRTSPVPSLLQDARRTSRRILVSASPYPPLGPTPCDCSVPPPNVTA